MLFLCFAYLFDFDIYLLQIKTYRCKDIKQQTAGYYFTLYFVEIKKFKNALNKVLDLNQTYFLYCVLTVPFDEEFVRKAFNI